MYQETNSKQEQSEKSMLILEPAQATNSWESVNIQEGYSIGIFYNEIIDPPQVNNQKYKQQSMSDNQMHQQENQSKDGGSTTENKDVIYQEVQTQSSYQLFNIVNEIGGMDSQQSDDQDSQNAANQSDNNQASQLNENDENQNSFISQQEDSNPQVVDYQNFQDQNSVFQIQEQNPNPLAVGYIYHMSQDPELDIQNTMNYQTILQGGDSTNKGVVIRAVYQ